MTRLNLTLDADTERLLEKHAKKSHARTATLARTLIREAIERREALERHRLLAEAYAADRGDARQLAAESEAGALDAWDELDG